MLGRRRSPLPHRVALVTGGARGIGRAIVEALLAEGLVVAIADRDELTAAHTATLVHDIGLASAVFADSAR